jgi:hypothetical protein
MTDDEARALVVLIEDLSPGSEYARWLCNRVNAVCRTHAFTPVTRADGARFYVVANAVALPEEEKDEC